MILFPWDSRTVANGGYLRLHVTEMYFHARLQRAKEEEGQTVLQNFADPATCRNTDKNKKRVFKVLLCCGSSVIVEN